jgi:hypothetical protein
VSDYFESDFRIRFDTFVDRGISILVLFITFIDFHSFLCRNAWPMVFLWIQFSFDGHIRIWFSTFVYRRICIFLLFITFINLLSFLSSNHSRAVSEISEAARGRGWPPGRRSGYGFGWGGLG